MRYAKFGSTDMVVSEIALGTWGIGGAGWGGHEAGTQKSAPAPADARCGDRLLVLL